MKAQLRKVIPAMLAFLTLNAAAVTRYVDLNSPGPTPPYTNWVTAATNIQDAVDVATAGDEVVVTDGIYASGGRAVYGTMTNRVTIDKPLLLRSLNGPAVTIIKGYQVAGVTNGDGAIRCVFLGDGAVLSGFTLTNGATRTSGDYSREQGGGGIFCNYAYGTATNCVLTGNSANRGGGTHGGTLNGCILTGNSANDDGGGAYDSSLNHCILRGNTASWSGGGAYFCILNNCILTGNSANSGGGTEGGTLSSCVITDNLADNGGGVSGGTLRNCAITGNLASQYGGGADLRYGGTLNACMLTGNSAQYGGGVRNGTLNNCIIYYNNGSEDDRDWSGNCELRYCCTKIIPTASEGNIGAEPQLASASHITSSSPCRGAGASAYATGVDIDGDPWLNPPSIGCDEYRAGAVTGTVDVAIGTVWTNVAVGYSLDLTARINGRVSASVWDFADGTVLSNRPYASHDWAMPGNYPVILTGYNESHPEGVTATLTIQVVPQPVHYVAASSTNPVPPFTNWQAAARTIQEAVDAVSVPGALVLVTNGIYSTGGRAVDGILTNRVALDRRVTVRSVNGPELTVIQGHQVAGTTNGDGAVRCVYLADGAVLNGFMLTNGATHTYGSFAQSGGGVRCQSVNSLVTNCILRGNSARWGGGVERGTLNNCSLTGNTAWYGGGAYDSKLNNCILTENSASANGGGAYHSTLNNCTLTGNWVSGVTGVQGGGGAASCELYNCILYSNSAGNGPDHYICTLHHCCITPLQQYGGEENISAHPLFLDRLNGNLRLQSNSPCINAGKNTYVTSGTDLDGNPRTVGGTVDIGAYEFQSPNSVLSYAWAQKNGVPTDGSADFTDNDSDSHNNWQEWRADTNPTNALSVLRMVNATNAASGLNVTWQSVSTRSYFLERATNFNDVPPFQSIATNIAGAPGTKTYTDQSATNGGPYFYRVGVQ